MKKLYIFVMGVFLLSACQQDITLDTTGRKITSNHTEKTCLIDEFEANPAAYHRSGSSNGFAFEGAPLINKKYLSSAAEAAQTIEAIFPTDHFAKDMVLVIADDFGAAQAGNSVYKLDASVYELSYSYFENASTITKAKTSIPEAMNAHFKTMLENGLISHGAQVLTLTLDLLEELGANVISMTDDQIQLELNGSKIIVQAVEVGAMNSAEITNAIQTVVNTYKNQNYENVVVNMSWTLEPCEAVTKFRMSKSSSFDKFLTSKAPSIGPGDPLYDYIHAANNRSVLFVAAAGNFGGSEPRQPAKMPNVISTSAQYAHTKGLKASFSNSAEVMTDGAYLRLRDPFKRNGVGEEAKAALFAGSSYAAPLNAVASLIDMGSTTPRCGFNGLTPRLADNAFSNPSLASAVATRCLP